MRWRPLLAVPALSILFLGACSDSSSTKTDFGVSRSTVTTGATGPTTTRAGGASSTTTSRPSATTSTTAGTGRTTSTTVRAGATTSTTARNTPSTTAGTTPTTARPAPAPTTAPPTQTIAISDFSYRPFSLRVPLNTRVRVVNQDGVDHTWVSNEGYWRSGNLDPYGGAFTQRFNARGDFPFHCDFHPNMTGIITVT